MGKKDTRWLRQNGTGRMYAWTESLAGRKDMIEWDRDKDVAVYVKNPDMNPEPPKAPPATDYQVIRMKRDELIEYAFKYHRLNFKNTDTTRKTILRKIMEARDDVQKKQGG